MGSVLQQHNFQKQPSDKRLSIHSCSMRACFVGACILVLTWRSTISIAETLNVFNTWLTSLPINLIPCSPTTVRGSSQCGTKPLQTTPDLNDDSAVGPDTILVDSNTSETFDIPSPEEMVLVAVSNDNQSSVSQIIESMSSSQTISTSNYVDFEPHVFEPWPNDLPLPCYKPDANWSMWDTQNTPTPEGIFYLKPYKTGSSSASGINLRIARNLAKRLGKDYDICKARFDHGPGYYPGLHLFKNRSPNKSFLWTALRDPTRRAVSAFFHFGVGRKKRNTTDASFIDFLNENHPPFEDYYFGALHSRGKFYRDKYDAADTADEIFSQFNFIGVTERLDESAVVLMMLCKFLPLTSLNFGLLNIFSLTLYYMLWQ
jgi:hypothetical protein